MNPKNLFTFQKKYLKLRISLLEAILALRTTFTELPQQFLEENLILIDSRKSEILRFNRMKTLHHSFRVHSRSFADISQNCSSLAKQPNLTNNTITLLEEYPIKSNYLLI